MARPALPAGARGEISFTVEPDCVYARCRYGDLDGKSRQVSARGKSKDAARRALVRKLEHRPQQFNARTTEPEVTLRFVAEAWFLRLIAEGRLAAGTLVSYRQTLDSPMLPEYGDRPIQDLTTRELDAFLLTDAASHPARAKRSKSVLGLVFEYAVRQGYADASPMASVGRLPRRELAEPRALTIDEVNAIRQAAADWEVTRRTPLAGIIDAGLAGLRIGEVLGLLRSEVELDRDPSLLRVSGTVMHIKKGLLDDLPSARRQDKAKSRSSSRTVELPGFIAESLRTVPDRGDLLFATKNGTPFSPHNVRRAWYDVLTLAGVTDTDVKFHSLRKTMATLTARMHGAEAAAEVLGQSDVAVTRKHYIAGRSTVSWGRTALDSLFDPT